MTHYYCQILWALCIYGSRNIYAHIYACAGPRARIQANYCNPKMLLMTLYYASRSGKSCLDVVGVSEYVCMMKYRVYMKYVFSKKTTQPRIYHAWERVFMLRIRRTLWSGIAERRYHWKKLHTLKLPVRNFRLCWLLIFLNQGRDKVLKANLSSLLGLRRS